MASLPETSTFDSSVYQLETNDPAQSGASDILNAPMKNLANRTRWLKDRSDDILQLQTREENVGVIAASKSDLAAAVTAQHIGTTGIAIADESNGDLSTAYDVVDVGGGVPGLNEGSKRTVGTDKLKAQLAANGSNPGAAIVGLRQGGSVQDAVGLQVITPLMFGAKQDRTTDDSDAIQAAADYANTLGVAHRTTLYFPPGPDFLTTKTVHFGRVTVVMDSRIVCSGSGSDPVTAIVYGAPGSVLSRAKSSIRVTRETQSNWNSEADIGVKIYNADTSSIEIAEASNFCIGAQAIGDSGGFAYNTIQLGFLYNNKIGLDVTNAATNSLGWCNENLFLGGRFGVATSTNTTKSRYGVRITSQATNKYYNDNNVFIKPSFELRVDSTSGGAEAVPILGEYCRISHFQKIRHENNSNEVARFLNDSAENWIEIGYENASSGATNFITSGNYASNFIRHARSRHLEEAQALVFDSGPIAKVAYSLDGGTTVRIPGVVLTSDAQGLTSLEQSTNLTIGLDYVTVGSARAIGIYLSTRLQKRFVMKRDSTAACRVVINCFDENGDLLTNASPAHPYVKGDIFANVSANYQNIYGGGYVSSDSTSDLYFEVGPNVASVRVLVARGSSSFGLRSFKIFAAPSRARAVTAYTGFEGKYIQPRTVRGSAAPSSGAWQAADICYNNAPSAGGNLGWVCVTSGSPGVWKAFGAIES